MEEEIDLREYVDLLVRRWKWIVGLTVLAALLAGIVSFMISPTYETTASVFVLPGITSNAQTLSPQTQLALLQSGNVAQRTAQLLGDKLSVDEQRALLRGLIRVSPEATDKSVFKITAQANTEQKALEFANTWANVGAAAINEEYDRALNISIPTLQRSVETTSKELQTAEEKLNKLQRDLQIDLLTQELTRNQQILNDQYEQRSNATLALAQARSVKQQVQQGQISLSAELLLIFQMGATTAENSFLIQPSQFVNLTKQQQLDQLDAIIAALNSREQALATSIAAVSSQVSTLQQQLIDKQAALIDPTRTRETARANYDRATTQLRDAQMRLATQQNPARVISTAVLPDSPISPKIAQNVAVAGVMGLLLSVFGVIAAQYLGKPRSA